MMIRKWGATLILLFIWAGTARAEVQLGGFFASRNQALTASGTALENDAGDFLRSDEELNLTLRQSSSTVKLYGSFSLWLDHMKSEPGSVDTELKEAYLDLPLPDWNLNLKWGKQIVAWGVFKELSPADLICPEDLRYFYTAEHAARRIGVTALKIDYQLGPCQLEGIYMPVFTADRLPGQVGAPWTPYSLRAMSEFLAKQTKEVASYIAAGRLPSDYTTQTAAEVDLTAYRPAPGLTHGESAVRMHTDWRRLELDLMFFDGYNRTPNLKMEKVLLQQDSLNFLASYYGSYDRYRAYAMDARLAYGVWDFKAEAVYKDLQYLPLKDPDDIGNETLRQNAVLDADGMVQKNILEAALGVDYYSVRDLSVSGGLHLRQILEYENELKDEEGDIHFLMDINYALLDRRLKLGFSTIVNVDRYDYMFKPYATFVIADNLEFNAGSYIFCGVDSALFGQFADNDVSWMELKYSF